MTNPSRIALAVALIVAAAAILSVCIHRQPGIDSDSNLPSEIHLDDGSLRYTYHLPSGDEGLFDLRADPKMLRNLRADRPADIVRLRQDLTRRIGVEKLEELRRAQKETLDRLRALGYF